MATISASARPKDNYREKRFASSPSESCNREYYFNLSPPSFALSRLVSKKADHPECSEAKRSQRHGSTDRAFSTNALPFTSERKGITPMAAWIPLLLVVHCGALVFLALCIGSMDRDRAALAIGRDHNVRRQNNLTAFF